MNDLNSAKQRSNLLGITQRELRFRAFDTVLQIMMPEFDNWIDFDGNYYTTPDKCYDTPNKEIARGHNYIITQYTGLLDIHGRRVFEGDFVKVKNHSFQHLEQYIYEVYYCPRSIRFKIRNNVLYPRNQDDDTDGYHSFEIVGNIFQGLKQLES